MVRITQDTIAKANGHGLPGQLEFPFPDPAIRVQLNTKSMAEMARVIKLHVPEGQLSRLVEDLQEIPGDKAFRHLIIGLQRDLSSASITMTRRA